MYKLQKLSPEVLQETAKDWNRLLREVEEHFTTWGYISVLNSAEHYLENGALEAERYTLVPLDSNVAEAIIIFTHKLPEMRDNPECAIKVLQIRTHPKYDSRVPEDGRDTITQRRAKTVKILSSLLTETLALTYDEFPANKLKVLVNKQADSDFFSRLEENLIDDGADDLGFSFSSHGNWFEISKSR